MGGCDTKKIKKGLFREIENTTATQADETQQNKKERNPLRRESNLPRCPQW